MDRFSRRTVKVTREHNEECRRLLRLMGIPVIVAPSEAEGLSLPLPAFIVATDPIFKPNVRLWLGRALCTLQAQKIWIHSHLVVRYCTDI